MPQHMSRLDNFLIFSRVKKIVFSSPSVLLLLPGDVFFFFVLPENKATIGQFVCLVGSFYVSTDNPAKNAVFHGDFRLV